jgi:hypothetical protein
VTQHLADQMSAYLRGYARGSADFIGTLVSLDVFTDERAAQWAATWAKAVADAADASGIEQIDVIEALSVFDQYMTVTRPT